MRVGFEKRDFRAHEGLMRVPEICEENRGAHRNGWTLGVEDVLDLADLDLGGLAVDVEDQGSG